MNRNPNRKNERVRRWFDNCGGWSPHRNLDELRVGIGNGFLNRQDEYGMTALSLAVSSGWMEGVDELLRAGADTELRYFRTGETALHLAVHRKDIAITSALINYGANPDAANHWGVTPREIASLFELASLFNSVPSGDAQRPAPWIQNAEHLADHHYPRFKIPDRAERETLQPDQAVDLYIYGPKSEDKQDTIKVRISRRTGRGSAVRYVAVVETPIEKTHLPPDTRELEFGPENVATVYVPREEKARKHRKPS